MIENAPMLAVGWIRAPGSTSAVEWTASAIGHLAGAEPRLERREPPLHAAQAPREQVTIEILDAKRQMIRTFTGTRADEQKADARRPDAPAAEESDFGPGAPRMRLTNAGLTRFAWDLRYPGATVFPGMILWSANAGQGPVAVPGSYQVRLTAGSHVETRQFAVKIDPRLARSEERRVGKGWRCR